MSDGFKVEVGQPFYHVDPDGTIDAYVVLNKVDYIAVCITSVNGGMYLQAMSCKDGTTKHTVLNPGNNFFLSLDDATKSALDIKLDIIEKMKSGVPQDIENRVNFIKWRVSGENHQS